MADPQQLQQQVEQLNNELNRINETIQSIGSSINKGARKQFSDLTEDVRNFGEGLLKSKNISKDINQLTSKLTELNKKNVSLSIERKVAEDKLVAASAKYNSEKSAANRLELIKAKYALRNYTLQLQLNEKLEDEVRKLMVIAEQQKKQNNLSKNLQGSLEKNLGVTVDQVKEMFTLAGMMKIIVDAAFSFNKASVNISKNLGYGAANADRVTNNIVNAARGSENLNFTLANAAEAMGSLAASTGLVAEYSADTLETQIMLTKQFGLTEDEAAGIYKFSVLTGKAASQVNKEMVGAFVATRNNLRVGAPFKATMAEAAKVSGVLASNLQNNPKRIVEAVVQAKALGTSLEQSAKQGEALLNFESSLENELKAELLTGRQINLERARAAALTGDQVTLAQELVKNVGTIEEFDRMNVLQKKAIAESVGLTADELANQLRQQKLAVETGKSLAQITEEEAIDAQKRQNIQEQFNQAILKLQDLIGGLVAGPLGMLLSILSDALSFVGKIVAGIQEILGSGITKVLLGTLAGSAFGPWGALIGGLAGLTSAIIADDMVGYGARTLITPDGPIALNNNDTVIAGTNLFKGDDVISMGKGSLSLGADVTPLVDAINSVKASVEKLYTKDTTINMDGKTVGTTLTQNSYKLA